MWSFFQRKHNNNTTTNPTENVVVENENRVQTRIIKPLSDASSIPHLPAVIWVTHVLPFLDRVSQNQLCGTCKDIYHTSKSLGIITAWPEGRFRIKRPVVVVAFSPGGNTLAILPSNSKTILVWNRRRGYDQSLNGHGGIVSDVTFAPNHVMASCSRTDGTIRLWAKGTDNDDDKNISIHQYTCIRQMVIRVFNLRHVRFSPCSSLLATWGYDGMIRLYKVENAAYLGSTRWRSRLGLHCFDSLRFPSKQSHLVAHSFNNEFVRLWNWTTQSSVELRDSNRITDYAAYITSIAMLYQQKEDREYLVVGCRVATVKLWDLNDYSCVRSIHLGTGWSAVTHLTFSLDGSKMACTSEGSEIRVYDVLGGYCMGVLRDHNDRVETLSISPDGEFLASGSCDRTLRLWSLTELHL